MSTHGVKLLPRDDVRPEEGCFYAVTETGTRIGYVQVFKDGTAGYWRRVGEQAKLAASPEMACAALLVTR